jgi:negative regulator of flagellin synthesis FlgM
MINSVGQASIAALEAQKLREGGKARATTSVAAGVSTEDAGTASSPASRMAAEGAPVELDRVAAIKAAIASGNYPINPALIAEKMLELDLPAGR